MVLMASIGLYSLKDYPKLKYLLSVLTLVYLLTFSIYLNFVNPWQKSNGFAYVHTDKDILNLVDELNLKYTNTDKIIIVSDVYWPLPFYLDNKNVEYLDRVDKANYSSGHDFYIVKDAIFQNTSLPEDYHSSKYLLREDENLHLVYKN